MTHPDTATYRAAARYFDVPEGDDIPSDDAVIALVERETGCDACCDDPEQGDRGDWSWTGRIYDRDTLALVGKWWSDGATVDVEWVRS